jgi:hypothetical protein
MKSVFAALIILASSVSFAQVTPAPAATPTPTPEQQAATTMILACSIEKYCAAGTATALDQYIVAEKANAAALFGGITCTDLEPVLVDPTTLQGLKDLAAQLTAAGQTTCLSTLP